MAKIAQQHIVLSVSKLVADKSKNELSVINDEIAEQLVEVLATLLDDPSLIIEKAEG